MTSRIQFILLFTLIIFFQQTVNAQAIQKDTYLQKVGALDSLYSQSLKEYRNLYVQLPADYNEQGNKKYPVVFILDGEVLLPAVNDVQHFYSGGFTPEMVLVGISNAKNRTRDLTTSKITEHVGIPFNVENGGADNFSRFMETELIPFIESKYPVTDFRTLIGHSYGGLFAIYTLIIHPQLFSNFIAIDPSLDWDDQRLLLEAKEKLATQNFKGKSLFMSLSGQLNVQNPGITIDNVMQDTSSYTLFSRSNIAFSNLVRKQQKNKLSFEWKFYPRDIHGTIPFPSIMDGLIFGFEWYQWENTDKFNSPTTTAEQLLDIINYRAKKLSDHFGYAVPPYPEEIFNTLGYMSMDRNQMKKAEMFFEMGIKYYPGSPNAYDSMAEYFEKINEYEKALKFAAKAYEMSANAYYKRRVEELKEKINKG